jgi:uncharacterized protein
MKKALIVYGGWEGHEPKPTAEIFAQELRKNDFEVEMSNTLDSFLDADKLSKLDLIVPQWTMGKITGEQCKGALAAIENGVGCAGIHGGMGDAFREATNWQFMVGGQWVAHPGGGAVNYGVHVVDTKHVITKGIKDFKHTSEQYYLHVDPINHMLATTTFETNGCVMPVAWTKSWGKGRVYYCSLGHDVKSVMQAPTLELITRGMLWAAKVYE